MKVGIAALFLACALAACSTDKNAVTQTGSLDSGTLHVIVGTGEIQAYPPGASDPKNRYTISVKSTPPVRIATVRTARVLTVCPVACPPQAVVPATDLLVRVPSGVRAQLEVAKGDIHVSDVPGPVDAVTTDGDIKIQIPSYANASTLHGNISVLFGDVNWPGELRYFAQHGDVEVYVPATADARVDLHTDHGIIFTDFDLRGKARGDSETIVGNIGKGGTHGVIVRVKTGNVRLLRLVPQM
ncbi:MAG: DUF4097 domain-containing protein [Candidatus Eremiobacteraeota bacterium]|nr:DUF4097 domain-containing protein [Candidatus Eremiobacteraeota bacterium]